MTQQTATDTQYTCLLCNKSGAELAIPDEPVRGLTLMTDHIRDAHFKLSEEEFKPILYNTRGRYAGHSIVTVGDRNVLKSFTVFTLPDGRDCIKSTKTA